MAVAAADIDHMELGEADHRIEEVEDPVARVLADLVHTGLDPRTVAAQSGLERSDMLQVLQVARHMVAAVDNTSRSPADSLLDIRPVACWG